MELGILDFELMIEVNVIQMQQWHDRRISANSPEVVLQIRQMEFG